MSKAEIQAPDESGFTVAETAREYLRGAMCVRDVEGLLQRLLDQHTELLRLLDESESETKACEELLHATEKSLQSLRSQLDESERKLVAAEELIKDIPDDVRCPVGLRNWARKLLPLT